jgi:asparagine synthase (glutamine-hydrolysing)
VCAPAAASLPPIANFVVTIDPDRARRRRFLGGLRNQMEPFAGLTGGQEETGDLAVAWAAGSRAPVDVVMDQSGAAMLWGEAITGDGRRAGAAEVRAAWGSPEPWRHAPYDGYHAAVRWDPQRGLVAAADPLGLFPVYHWSQEDVTVIASSADSFRHHPAFTSRLDLRGLVGILLTMHPVGGRTLQQSVRRLGAGAMLQRPAGGHALEVAQFPLAREPSSDAHLHDEVALLDDAVTRAVERHAPRKGACGLLLTGGRDSRIVAGCLREAGRAVRALSWGEPHDHDVVLARRVARTLRIPHVRRDDPDPARLTGQARLQARWHQLNHGFNTVWAWGSSADLAELPAMTLNGYVFGSVVGGEPVDWAWDPREEDWSFDAFFARINAWAVPRHELKRLLRPTGCGELVEEVVDQIRHDFEGYGETPQDGAWCFDLHHRQRFHVANSLWPGSFRSWPAVPGADGPLLRSAGRLSHGALRSRVAQDALLCRRFPRLARLPIDHNDDNPRPLLGSRRWSLERRVRAARQRRGWATPERRRYYRLLDFEGAGWRSVRGAAEPLRELVSDIFDPAALADVLPPPEERLVADDAIVGSSGAKCVLGFMLWRAHSAEVSGR